jgi:hypothetical protein
MKYIEQRIEELEKQVQELKIKLFQKEFKEAKHDYIYNHPNMTLLSQPNSETAFPPYPNILGSWDPNPDYVDSTDLPTYYPPANPEDVIEESASEYEFKMNCPDYPTIVEKSKLNFDKMDKDFLNYMNSNTNNNSTNKYINNYSEKSRRTKN